MKFLKPASIVLVLFLVSCASVQKQTRINTPLQVCEFNSVASDYYHRPTFTKLNTMTDGEQTLLVQVDTYGSNDAKVWVNFGEANAAKYISMIDKYLEWEELASNRGDQFKKRIGKAQDGSKMMELTFSFFSGNATSHYLVISNCVPLGLDCVGTHYYDKKMLLSLKSYFFYLRKNS